MADICIDGYWTEEEAARRLGVAIGTLRTWAARRKGPPRTTFHRKVVYRIDAVLAWLRKQETDPEAARNSDRRRGETA